MIRAPQKVSTRYIGWCPVCQRDIKVRSRMLVHHGYQRPGVGYIVGDCPGVGYEPFELGTEAADAYRANYVRPNIDALERNLRVLESPEGPPWLHFERYDFDARRIAYTRGRPELIKLTRAEAEELAGRVPYYDREKYSWDRRLRIAIAQVESQLDFWGKELARIEGLIAAWQPMPLRTAEEEIRRQEQSKAERETPALRLEIRRSRTR
jgi:hypothetical protein